MDKDVLLSILISLVEDGGEVPLILSAGGTLVEGDLVSEQKYFEEIAALIKSETPGIQDVFRNIPSLMDRAAIQHLEEEDTDPEEAQQIREDMAASHIHLKNTRVWSEGREREMVGTLWRGKVEAVDGFWLGRSD